VGRKKKIGELGIQANNVNLIGHSLGALVSYELSKKLYFDTGKKVKSIVALDPANLNLGLEVSNGLNFFNSITKPAQFVLDLRLPINPIGKSSDELLRLINDYSRKAVIAVPHRVQCIVHLE
jgi:thioesterase domain-containing protein